jgi:hypothetical protein
VPAEGVGVRSRRIFDRSSVCQINGDRQADINFVRELVLQVVLSGGVEARAMSASMDVGYYMVACL